MDKYYVIKDIVQNFPFISIILSLFTGILCAAVKPKKGFPVPALIAIVAVLALFFGAGGLFIGSRLLAKPVTPPEEQDPDGPVFIAEYATVTFQGNRFDVPLEYSSIPSPIVNIKAKPLSLKWLYIYL